jgi:hypothetical protein
MQVNSDVIFNMYNFIYTWLYQYISNLDSDLWVFFVFWTIANIIYFIVESFAKDRKTFRKDFFEAYEDLDEEEEKRRKKFQSTGEDWEQVSSPSRITYIFISLIPFFTVILGILFLVFCSEMTILNLLSWCFFHLIWGPRWFFCFCFCLMTVLCFDSFSRIK